MGVSYVNPNGGGKPAVTTIGHRLERARAADAVSPDAARMNRSAPLGDAARALLAQAGQLAAQPNWLCVTAANGTMGGVRFVAGELHAWAIDQHNPLRSLAVAVIIDGSVVMEAFTSPRDAVLLVPSAWHLADHATLELVIDGETFLQPGFTEQRFWTSGAVRTEQTEFLDRLRRGWRAQRARRRLQRDISGTLDRLASPEVAQDNQPVPFLRYLAASTNTPMKGHGPLALANWIMSDVLEDPLRRELFCLDPITEALLNEPAFNVRALRGDITLALLCFWRRHYQTLDLFSDDGLRRIQFKFVTAPFIRLKNNDRLVTPAIRAQMSAPASMRGGAVMPWSWYWVCLLQDQNSAARLDDPAHLLAVSFREVVADALDPERLSYNPDAWRAWWGSWACGLDAAFSRFDLALIALLQPGSAPAALVAEQGGEFWRTRLREAFYRPMPGLAALSLIDETPAVREEIEEAAPVCDLAIIGYTNGTGLARNMAMFVEALAPCQPLVFDARTARCTNADQQDAGALRARVVLLCLNAGHAPEVIARFAGLCADAHVIGFFLWETDQPPDLHRFGALAVDEIWTPSQFVADAYARITDVPISVVGKGLRAPPPARWQRSARRFRRDGAFTFLSVADFSSSIVRKNPLASAQAFRAAFDEGNGNVRLVIKLRDVDRGHWSNIDGYWDELETLAARDPRIEFLIGDLSDDEYWALLASCDALLSLHRGEGFSYPVADAMMLGRPVVVTDYSGTRDFCTEQTAFLVEADVIATPPSHLRCTGPIGHWAIPRQDSAVAAMRRVVAQRAEAAARGAAAQAMIANLYDFAEWRGDLLQRLAPHLPAGRAAPGQLIFSSLAPEWSASAGSAD